MKFGILGPIEVTADDGAALGLGKRKDRALLTVLLLRAGETVSVDGLIDALWPAGPPARPDASLHSSVARLRRVLEPDRGPGEPARVLLRRAPGYAIDIEGHELDARRFEQLGAQGRAALRAGDPVAASGLLHESLALWRGPALGEFAYEPFAEREAERLESVRVAVLEDRLAADLACGATDLVAELEQLVATHPLRERLWEHLLVALYRAGRQTEAVRRAQSLRDVLADVGLEPSPRLRALEDAILRHDVALEVGTRPRPAPATAVDAAPGDDRRRSARRADDPIATDPEPPAHSTTPPAPDPRLPRWWRRPVARFVGRSDELHRFAVTWKATADGEAALVVATGEPGIGKSWLAMEVAERCVADGAVLVAGRCSAEPALPFEPFVEALGRLVDALTDDDLAALGEHAARLASLLPSRATRLGADPNPPATARERRAGPDGVWDGPERRSSSAGVEQHLLFEATSTLVALVTARAPVVMLLDDLQWADRSTLRLLEHLLRSDLAARLMVLATLRDTEADAHGRVRRMLDQLHREHLADEVVLTGFTVEEVGVVLADRPDDVASPELAHALRAVTGGNPFFVVEMARSIDEGHSSPDALTVPTTAQALVRSRLDRLGPDTRELLVTAALVDRRVDIDLLARVSDLDADEVGAALDRAVAAGLLDARDAQLTFRHDLVRNELAASLGPASRPTRHRAIAEALRARAGDDADAVLDALAHHFGRAAADGDPTDAVRYARAAGTRALANLAHHTAVSRFEHGLAALATSGTADPAAELDLLLDLAEAWRRTGELAECGRVGVQALPLAVRVGDATQQRRAAFAAGFVLNGPIDADELRAIVATIDDVDRRLAADPDASADDRALVSLTCAEVAARLSDGATMLRRSHEARQHLADATDPVTVVTVLDSTLLLLGEREPIAERLAVVERLLLAAEAHGDREALLLAHSDARWVHLTAGDVSTARRHGAVYEALAAQLGMPRYHAGVAQRRAMQAILAGRFAEAEAYAEEMLEHRPDAEFFEGYAAQVAVIRWEQGRAAELAELMGSVETASQAVWDAASALVAAELGQRDDAGRLLDEVTRGFARQPLDATWLTTFAVATRAAVELGDTGAALRLAEPMGPYADRIVVAGTGAVCLGPVSLYLGLLSGLADDLDAAEAWLDRAQAHIDALDAAALDARSRLWRAELLTRLGGAHRADDARRHLVEGLAAAERLGLGGGLVDRSRARVSGLA